MDQVRRIFPHHGGGGEKQRGRVRLVRGGGGIGLSCKHIATSTDNCMGEPNGRQLWSVNTAGSCQVDPSPGHVILVVIPC